MENCIFCKIIKGEIPAAKVYESDKFLAFLDISPCNKGHTLIIPKEHYVSLNEIPNEDGKEFGELQIKLAKSVMEATNAGGFNLLLNDGKVAGQEVMHAHLHIQPRFNTDEFSYKWTHTKYEEGEIQKFQDKIKEFLQ
ncbi:HIT family protein [Candidatus Woesearchaeota archaeon]|mgnify:CR=1 FL=1|nr:HIT family protein [Candidatus Woesearchaeota archaeon]|tara:strand:- start:3929 stop:4342 length:414 start_codon:yes stop_codon:yes gene_type:complete